MRDFDMFCWRLQTEDEESECYLKLPQHGMILPRLELDMTSMFDRQLVVPAKLLLAATEVHAFSSEEAVESSELILAGFASTSALYEELLASNMQEFWVNPPVSLRVCPTCWDQHAAFGVELSDMEAAAQAAMATGQGYLALTGATITSLGVTFRLTRVSSA